MNGTGTATREAARRRRRAVVAGLAALACIAGLVVLASWRGRPTDSEPAVVTRCVTGYPERAQTSAQASPQTSNRALTDDPNATAVARMLVSSAENSSLDWEEQYGYIEYDVENDPEENRGYTAGIVGFTSKTHDMLTLVRRYAQDHPGEPLSGYLPALEAVDGSSSADGLGSGFVAAWRRAAATPEFQQVQRDVADEMYLRPAVADGRGDGLGLLGQFIYYDAMVMHGPGSDPLSFGGTRGAALEQARPPADGGDETAYLLAFLDARRVAMRAERAHGDTSRVDAQERFLREGNLSLTPPLQWSVYGDAYAIRPPGSEGC